jgi:hypothetical protein
MEKVVYLYHELHNILPSSGCYCWFIDWSQIQKQEYKNSESKRRGLIQAIANVYSPNSLLVKASREGLGNIQEFGESYEGALIFSGCLSEKDIVNVSRDFDVFYSYLGILSSIIFPLYIGKSKNLNKRVRRHIDYLNDADNQSNLDLDYSEQEILKNFSQRFNKILQRNRVLGLRDHMLSIKVIYLPEELISSFEKNLNYIYKPIFGIR